MKRLTAGPFLREFKIMLVWHDTDPAQFTATLHCRRNIGNWMKFAP